MYKHSRSQRFWLQHCKLRNDPGSILGVKLPPVKGKDPTLEFEDTDPFIKDYFHRMRNDIDQPLPVVAGEPNDFMRPFVSCCSHWTFFIINIGLLGVGPRATRPGDKAAVISAGRMPFVVRTTNLVIIRNGILDLSDPGFYRYTIAGPAYIHHLMKGEGVLEVEPGKFQWDMTDFIWSESCGYRLTRLELEFLEDHLVILGNTILISLEGARSLSSKKKKKNFAATQHKDI